MHTHNTPSLLATSSHVFLLGIKGVAMSGIATILSQMGKRVSGSDTDESQITDRFLDQTASTVYSLSSSVPDDVDLVVYSAAHGGISSLQVVDAVERGIPVMHQADMIQHILRTFPVSIAVCGCHGKTGTASLLVYTLKRLGMKVSWLIGAPHFIGDPYLPTGMSPSATTPITYPGAFYDASASHFVFEADEYGVCPPSDNTPKLEWYTPTHIICTTIDFDHPDVYRDLAHTTEVFDRFFQKSSHVYRFNSTSIEGNALGLVTFLRDLGYTVAKIHAAMEGFVGAKRRMEQYGTHGGIDLYDDYAHHPAEIVATISAIRKKHPGQRVVILFQSHTYSRTQSLAAQFVDALALADRALIDEIFPSARESSSVQKITAKDLEKIAQAAGHKHITGFASRSEMVEHAKMLMRPGDVVVTMGAGDIYTILGDLIQSCSASRGESDASKASARHLEEY